MLFWIYHVWSSKEGACFDCAPSVHLSVSCICFVYVFVCRKLSPHLRARSQVVALLMLSLCVICIICGRVRACSCYVDCHLVCCACLPSV